MILLFSAQSFFLDFLTLEGPFQVFPLVPSPSLGSAILDQKPYVGISAGLSHAPF